MLGLGKDGKPNHTKKPLDFTGVEVIVLDEVYLIDRPIHARLRRFINDHPEIRFIATGDQNQLRSVHDSKNQYLQSNGECIDALFPIRLHLEVIKRVKREEDRLGYPAIRQIIFKEHMPNREVIAKFNHLFGKRITSLKNLKTKVNLSVLNETREVVNEFIFEKVEGKTQMKKAGQVMICKGYVAEAKHTSKAKEKGKPLTKNRTYEVKKKF